VRSPFIVLVLVASATASAAPPSGSALVCPHDGGRTWRATQTAHVRLATDVDADRVTSLAAELEDIHDELARIAPVALLGTTGVADGVVDVLAFKDNAALEQLGKVGMLGYILRDQIAVVDVHNDQILRHELTHHMVTRLVGDVPRWVHEGIAEYLATASLDDGQARVGDIPDRIRDLGGRGRTKFAGRSIPRLHELLAAPDAEFDGSFGLYYAAAWTLVHLVNNEHPEHRPRFRAFLQALSRGVAPDEAWRKAFGPVLPALEHQYDEFLATICAKDEFVTSTISYKGVRAPETSGPATPPRTLSDGEVHARWLVRESGSVEERLARGHAALAHDPDSLDLRLALWELERLQRADGSDDALAALAAAHPDDEQIARLRLEAALFPQPHGDAGALAAQLTRGTHTPASDAALGLYWMQKRDRGRAFSFARRGLKFDQACAGCWLVLTYVYLADGQISDANMAFSHVLAMFDRRQPLPPQIAVARAALAKLTRRASTFVPR
jgi:hypothetical protein